tara:strand:+ start:3476 stop:4762 length:1287 start_codon:yes stop_codon:yes gene_type:complete
MENIIVIGGGLIGSSTAWELSKYGEEVLLIEQQDSVYTFGSSFGEARISRSLGPKNDIFSYLQQTSVRETQDLVDYLNKDSKLQIHQMEDIYTTSPVTYIYDKAQLNQVKNILNGQTDKYEYAPNSKKAYEFFGMNIQDSTMVIREYKKYSGTLNPKVLISKLHDGIIKKGNRINYNEKVTDLKKVNGLYEIEVTNSKTGKIKKLFSKKVVASAGPFNGNLVKGIAPYFESLISPKRLFLAFFKIKSSTYKKLNKEQINRFREFYPIAYMDSETFYSMIEKYDDHGIPIIKVGGHFLRTEIKDLSSVWQKELSMQEIKWSKENTINYLRSLNLSITENDLEFYSGYSCVYSMTKTEIPYVTNILNDSKIDQSFVLAGGMSGIGAKGSLTYGLIAANLLLNKKDTSPMYNRTLKELGSDRLSKDVLEFN